MKRFFDAHEYKTWEFYTPVFSPKNVRGCEANAYVNQADCNVLAIHKDKEPPACVNLVDEFQP